MNQSSLISKADKLRKSIAAKTLDISELQAEMESMIAAEEAALVSLQSQLSEVEQEAADTGFSVAKLHEAVDAARDEEHTLPSKSKRGK